MTTPVNDAITQIAASWESVTPPDRPTILYREANNRQRSPGATSTDRVFEFDFPQRSEPVGQQGPQLTTVEWLVTAYMTLSQGGRSARTGREAAANEANILMRTVEMINAWPVGVIEVITNGVAIEREGGSKGDTLLTFQFRITTFETDGG